MSIDSSTHSLWRAGWVRDGLLFLLGLLVAVLVVFVLWLAWALWGVGFFYDSLCSKGADCAVMGQVGDLFGGVNALFAGLALAGLVISIEASRRANAREREWERDKEFVNQVRATYEWAFLALSGGSRNAEAVAKRDRLGWLSAARHLSRAAKLESQVKSEAMHAILGEHKEYWRLEIHRLLDRTDLGIDFMASIEGADVEPYIEYRSALVIAQFLESGRDDPIDAVDAHALINSPDFEHGRLNRAIERYIVQTLPGFLDDHLMRFPEGRVAKLRQRGAKAAVDRRAGE